MPPLEVLVPKPTFDNLPPDKRRRIVELAIEEFSELPYAQASLSRIVSRAGIAKGSIYQYFENKLDLYRWLITDEVGRRKLAAIESAAPPPDASVWEVLKSALRAGVQFAVAEPRLAVLGTRFLRDRAEPDLKPLADEHRRMGLAWLRGLLEEGRRRGEVRGDLDLDLASALLSVVLGEGLLELLALRLGVDLQTFLAEPERTARLTHDDVEAVAEASVGILQRGLGEPATPTDRRRRSAQ